jgi:hypothetical protein
LVTLSSALCLTTTVFWVRSYWRHESVKIVRPGSAAGQLNWDASSSFGRIVLEFERIAPDEADGKLRRPRIVV